MFICCCYLSQAYHFLTLSLHIPRSFRCQTRKWIALRESKSEGEKGIKCNDEVLNEAECEEVQERKRRKRRNCARREQESITRNSASEREREIGEENLDLRRRRAPQELVHSVLRISYVPCQSPKSFDVDGNHLHSSSSFWPTRSDRSRCFSIVFILLLFDNGRRAVILDLIEPEPSTRRSNWRNWRNRNDIWDDSVNLRFPSRSRFETRRVRS